MDFNQAKFLIQDVVESISTQKFSKENELLSLSSGRILSENIFAEDDFPSSDNSAMDGYAICHSHLLETIKIQGCCYPGDQKITLLPKQAIRLFTGALIPKGADTVIPQEYAYQESIGKDSYIKVSNLNAIEIGQHVRKQGEDIKKNDLLLLKGTKLKPSSIALLASQGIREVSVYSKPKVGILTTGGELVDPGSLRSREQIYNSNGTMLESLVRNSGLDLVDLKHCIDDEYQLLESLKQLASNCDLVITAGGASVGQRDLIKQVVKSLGGHFKFEMINMKPGKPVALAQIQKTFILCLPGNPVSAYVTFILFGIPLIRAIKGQSELFPPVRKIPIRTDKNLRYPRDNFLRVQRILSNQKNLLELICYPKQDSGFLTSISWADGLAKIPANTIISDLSLVDYYDLRDWLE